MSHLCRYLRWKGFHGQAYFTPEEIAEHYARNEVQWSCLLSAQPWGPDDDVCAPETCAPGRGCFVESPKLARPLA